MAKQLNVNLAFRADTTQAKQQLQQLQTQLNNLTTSSVSQQLPITPKLQEAQNAAINLKIALQQSMNVDTGKFDLTKFNNSLKRAGTSLNQMRVDLSKFGPEGQQAFMTLAQSIMQAEVPMRRTNALLAQLGTTLKNTAKWQISSMALHGFMGAISGAYDYAQDLNESLNNIRIVTGKNIDDMKKFADQANKAAKALSTTTTAYTDASLIYYQQGLSDAEVLKRADVTVKMANATGQAAEVVSDQMTAIWNNFYDGSKALEYYSDVVTALGAATASSSDEIAEGLEKFAAVADTVGLSYEYATSALATVTATTRQSADVVGTAFKTLFARIQDLELGKTLDDGTTLGAYAESLQAVGINIKESNGELKKMDDILNEMGSVWKTLGNDQQAALAQSVAGVRQYTQLMALMENWDYFKDNLEVAKDATGTLQEQADIYAESWEAAQKRVQASAQAIYQDLISDEFFIDLQNNFADFLGIIDKAIDGMGGLKGVVALLGGVLLTAFSGQAARGLENMAYNIKMMTAWGQQEIMQAKELAYQEAMRVSNSGYITETQEAQVKVMQNQLRLQNDLVEKANKISEEEKERCQAIINENKLYGEQLIELTKIKEEISDAKSQEVQNVKLKTIQNQKQALTPEQNKTFGQSQELVQIGLKAQEEINRINNLINTNKFDSSQSGLDAYKIKIKELIQELSALGKANVDVEFLQSSLENLVRKRSPEVFKNLIHEMATDTVASTNGMASAIQFLSEALGLQEPEVQKLVELMYQLSEADNKAATSQELFNNSVLRAKNSIAEAKAAMVTWADSLVHIASGVSSLVFAIQSLSSIGEVFNNEDMTTGEKFLQITMSLSMAIPMLVNGLKALSLAKWKDLGVTTASTIVKMANAAATKAQADQEARAAQNTDEHTDERKEQIVVEGADTVINNTPKQKGFFSGIKDSWNKNALQNNSNFKFDEESGKYLTTNKRGKQVALNEKWASKLAGKQALSGLGSILGTLGLVAAGIAVAAASITIASNVYNKDAKAAEKASKSAAKAAEMYQNTRAKYEELKSTVSGYQDQVKAISEMTKGTLEWKEAINAANEEALKLIDTYDILDYSVNKKTGLIEFGEGAIEAAQAKEFGNMTRAQRASLSADVYASEAQMKADTTKFNREYASHMGMSDEDWAIVGGATVAGAGTGAAIGAIVGSIVPVIGNAVGAGVGAAIGAGVGLIGGAIGAAIDNDSEEQEEDAIDKLVKIYDAKGSGMFADSEFSAILDSIGVSESLKESLLENKEETQKLIQELHANTESNRLKNQQQMQSYLDSGNNAVYSNSEYQTQIAGILANSKAFDEAKQEAEDAAWKGRDKNIHKAYAEYMGYEFVKDTHSGTGKFKDAQGNEVEIDDETMVEFLTNEYARQEAAKNVEEVSALLDSLTNISGLNDDDMTTAQSAIADFIAGDSDKLLALSDEQMDAVKEQLKNGISLTDEEAQMLGYDNAKAFTEAFDKQLENWSSMSAEQRAEKMAAIKQQEFDSAIASTAQSLGVSSEALEGYTKALQSANPELKDNSEAAIAAAKANINFSKGVAKLDEALKDNYDILHDWNEESFETYEAAGKVQAAIKEIFGVDVSANFVRDNLQELQELTEGNTEHLDELREAAAKDFVVNLGLEEGATNALDSTLDALINQDREGIKIGAEVDLGSSVDQLNQFLKDGTLTAEQVTQAFNAIGYEPEIGYITDKGQETHTSNRIEWNGLPLGTVDSYTTSDVSIPYIKSSTNKDSKGNSNKSSATKTTSTGSIAANLAGSKIVQDKQDKKEDRLKSLKNEIERYRLLNETVEDLERNLDALGKAKDRAYGGAKIGYMQAERKELERNVELAKERLRLAEEYYQQDLQELSQYGIRANKDGQIENWDEILQKQIDKMKGMDSSSDAYEDEEQRLDDMKSAYDKYMQSLDDVKDAQQEIIDNQNAVIDSLLEEAEFKVEFKIEADEFTMEVLEHFLSRLEDDAFAAADAIALIGQQMEVTAGQIDTYMQGINNVLGATLSPEEIQKVMAGDLSNIDTSKLTEQQIEDLKEYANGLMEVENQLREQHTAVHEKLTESIEAWNEEFDKNMAKFEKYNAVVENYKNIIDIVGKDRLGISDETIKNMYDTQKKIANDQLASAKARKESAQFTYDEIKAAYDNAVALYGEDSEIAKKWKEQMEAAEETLNDATSEFYDSWQNALQAAADAFAANVETIVENFEKSVSGAYDSLDALQETFDRQKEINERYLDTYEKTYEINKLNRKINQDIAKTTNIKSQKELRDLQEQLLDLNKEGSKVSERDIQFMQKKYDLLVAEQALRDAQNAKSTVKLSRDSEGNYSYIYTADQSNIDAATQSYEDAAYNLEKWNEETLITISEQIITIKQNFAQAIQDIANDANLSDEERKRKMEETTIYYTGQLKYWTDEAVRLNEYATQANSQFHMDMADSIHESIVGQIMPDIVDWEELYRTDSEAMQKASDDLDKAIDVMAYDIDKAMGEAGTSVEDFRESANEDFLSVQGEAEKTKGKIIELKSTIETELPKAKNAVQAFETQFNGYMDLIIQKIGSLTGGGVLGAIQKLINGCKEGLRAQKALEEKDYSYTGEEAIASSTTQKPSTIQQPSEVKKSGADYGWTGSGKVQSFEQLLDGTNGVVIDGQFYSNSLVSANGINAGGKMDVGSTVYYIKNKGRATKLSLSNVSFDAKNASYITLYDANGTKTGTDTIIPENLQYVQQRNINGIRRLSDGTTLYHVDSPIGTGYHMTYWLNKTDLSQLYGLSKVSDVDNFSVALPMMNTGGYTGEWGPEGRLAVLHQKEIVLNAHDTENLLSIVSMVRDMNDRIELNARAMQYGLTAAYTANNIKSQNDTLQQEVHITAEFPNATNHSEIEEAFRNLTNLASQYANRKF